MEAAPEHLVVEAMLEPKLMAQSTPHHGGLFGGGAVADVEASPEHLLLCCRSSHSLASPQRWCHSSPRGHVQDLTCFSIELVGGEGGRTQWRA
jgi:hypothetical protein